MKPPSSSSSSSVVSRRWTRHVVVESTAAEMPSSSTSVPVRHKLSTTSDAENSGAGSAYNDAFVVWDKIPVELPVQDDSDVVQQPVPESDATVEVDDQSLAEAKLQVPQAPRVVVRRASSVGNRPLVRPSARPSTPRKRVAEPGLDRSIRPRPSVGSSVHSVDLRNLDAKIAQQNAANAAMLEAKIAERDAEHIKQKEVLEAKIAERDAANAAKLDANTAHTDRPPLPSPRPPTRSTILFH